LRILVFGIQYFFASAASPVSVVKKAGVNSQTGSGGKRRSIAYLVFGIQYFFASAASPASVVKKAGVNSQGGSGGKRRSIAHLVFGIQYFPPPPPLW
jgi:hypothetical protein